MFYASIGFGYSDKQLFFIEVVYCIRELGSVFFIECVGVNSRKEWPNMQMTASF